MAHEPKLEVFKIYLKPYKNTEISTFRTYLEKKYKENDTFDIDDAYRHFFQDFISLIDNDYYRSEKRKKAFGLRSVANGATVNLAIEPKFDQRVIEGTVKGGRYGQNRSLGNIEEPSEDHQIIPPYRIILDNFYFLLYTPLKSNKGLLFIQSYTDDHITDIFKTFITKLFTTNGFYGPNIEAYCPVMFRNEFLEHSFIKEFVFRQDVVISAIDQTQAITTDDLSIEIKIKAKSSRVRPSTFRALIDKVKSFKFKSEENVLPLEDFKKKIGKIENAGHESTFELDDESFNIKPTIYLQNRIELQADGTPNWNSLKQYCQRLLEQVKQEVYPENEISED